jgi:hypothetical protein
MHILSMITHDKLILIIIILQKDKINNSLFIIYFISA